MKRAKKGRPRIEDRARTIEARKPWLKLEMSRRTWRSQASSTNAPASFPKAGRRLPCAANAAESASWSGPRGIRPDVRARQT
jgi:hypothetical protein